MLTLNDIRENKEEIIQRLTKRGWSVEQSSILGEVIELDDQRKATQTELDGLLNQIKTISKEIGNLYKSGKAQEAEASKIQVAEIKEKSTALEQQQKEILVSIEDSLLQIPNVPHESVPAGATENDNEVYKDWPNDLPVLSGDAQPHWELASKYNLIDFELGTKITGSGFPLYRGKGARLQRALINFFLNEATEAGYEEVMPPLLVNADTARATGQLPDKEGQMYYMPKDDLYLIPTAEVPVTNIYRDVILSEGDLPIKLTGHTPCFRREAGSYGSDVKGLNRVHQFDKIEIVQVTHPDQSYDVLYQMMDHVSSLLNKLELPFRILRLCGGDSAAQKKWLEVSSVSNFETYQTNRLKLRFKDANGKKQLAHTLNGSALALARIVAALLENHPDGINIPAALVPYTGFDKI